MEKEILEECQEGRKIKKHPGGVAESKLQKMKEGILRKMVENKDK